MNRIKVGDIVTFKRVRKINLADLIARKKYSKYMLVISVIKNYKKDLNPKTACKVLCANGEVNWVGANSIEIIKL